MKIGFDAKRLFSNGSGLGNYSRTLVRNLTKFYPDHQFHLYTTKVSAAIDTLAIEKSPATTVTYVGHSLKAYWRTFSIKKDLRAAGIQIYHGLSHEIPFNLQKTGIKSVVTIHDLIYRTHPELFPLIDRKIYHWKFSNSIANADRIIAISENTRQDILRYFAVDPAKIRVIYQSCAPAFQAPFLPGAVAEVRAKFKLPARYLLFVGTISRRKNIEVILRAMSMAPAGLLPDLVIIGRGKDYQEKIEALAHSLGLQERLQIINNLDDTPDLVQVYRGATVVIYPSIYEGFGLPIAEGMLAKVPVIAADNSSLREAGGPSTRYFNPDQPGELVQQLTEVLNQEALREEMIRSGYAYAMERFSDQRTAEQLMELYREVLAE